MASTSPAFATAFRHPLNSGFTLSQQHNERSQYLYDKDPDYEYHIGEDWANGRGGDPVNAAANGKVVFAGTKGSFGNLVVIQHTLANGDVVSSVYGHLATLSVSTGQTVTIGQKIGSVGHTGIGTGDHLHFGIYLGAISGSDAIGFTSYSDPDVRNSGWVSPTYFISNFKPPVVDTTPPQLSSTSPADNATKVATNADIVLTFNEKVAAGTGTIEIWTKSGKLFESISVSDSSRVHISGSTVTVDPKNLLGSGADYYVQMKSGVIKDIAGNSYAGITSKTQLSFTTASDTTAPKLVSSKPADDAGKVSTSADIVLKFNEDVAPGSGKIEIYKSNGKLFESIDVNSSRVDFDGKTVTIDPKGKFDSNSGYYVKFGSGVIEDLAGNDFRGIAKNDLNFTTGSSSSSSSSAQVADKVAAADPVGGSDLSLLGLAIAPGSLASELFGGAGAGPFASLSANAFGGDVGGGATGWSAFLDVIGEPWQLP